MGEDEAGKVELLSPSSLPRVARRPSAADVVPIREERAPRRLALGIWTADVNSSSLEDRLKVTAPVG